MTTKANEYVKKHRAKPTSGMYSPKRFLEIKLKTIKRDAPKRNLEFNITVDDLVIPTHCPYLELELTFKHYSGQLPTNASIDRIDNSKGYIPGNVEVISTLANRMKNAATIEQLLTFSKNAIQRHATSFPSTT